MLSWREKLRKKLIRLRMKQGWSQRGVAQKTGLSQPYLAQVEMGERPLSRKGLEKMEAVYGISLQRYSRGVGRPGRPKYWAATREAMRKVARGVRELWSGGEARAPAHPQPHQVDAKGDPLWPMALHLGLEARTEVERLEELRAEDDFFWRQFNWLRFDSWSEKRLLVRVALLGAQLMGVRLNRLGCSLKVIDGVTGGAPGVHRAFVLKGREASVVWCPQVAVRTGRGERCLDNLLIVSDGSKSVTVAVEVNGAPYHSDAAKERRRDRELGIPVLHVDAARVGDPGLIGQILKWAHAQLVAT